MPRYIVHTECSATSNSSLKYAIFFPIFPCSFTFYVLVLSPAPFICVFVRLIFLQLLGLYASLSLNYFAKLYVNSIVALTCGFGSDATHSLACSSFAFQYVVFFSVWLFLVRLCYTQRLCLASHFSIFVFQYVRQALTRITIKEDASLQFDALQQTSSEHYMKF